MFVRFQTMEHIYKYQKIDNNNYRGLIDYQNNSIKSYKTFMEEKNDPNRYASSIMPNNGVLCCGCMPKLSFDVSPISRFFAMICSKGFWKKNRHNIVNVTPLQNTNIVVHNQQYDAESMTVTVVDDDTIIAGTDNVEQTEYEVKHDQQNVQENEQYQNTEIKRIPRIPLTRSGTFDISTIDYNDERCQIIYRNLKVIREINVNDKLCVDNNGELSVDISYLPSLTRKITGNNRNVTMDRVHETINIARELLNKYANDERYTNEYSELNNLFDHKLVAGLKNLSETYASYEDVKNKIDLIIQTI